MSRPANPEFICQLTDCQPWLRAFVRSLLPFTSDVDEVVQRANVVLWQKADSFEEGTNFRAWASQVARFEVLAYSRERGKDRHMFSAEMVQSLAEEADRQLSKSDDIRTALRTCLAGLGETHRDLIRDRYTGDDSVQEIAEKAGRTPDAVSAMLYRIKKLLLKCIHGRLATDWGGEAHA